MVDTRQVKKHNLIEFYNLSERDHESIEALASLDNDGRFKKQLLALELALGDTGLAKKRFLSQIEDSAQFAADLTHFATHQQLYKKLLETLRLTNGIEALSTDDYRYTKETILESGFIAWVDEHRPILQGIITIPSIAQLNRDPLRFISMLLGNLGLKQKRVGRSENAIYHLDIERIQLLNALMKRRTSGLLAVSTPLNTSSVAVKKELSAEFFVDCFHKIKKFFTAPEYFSPALT